MKQIFCCTTLVFRCLFLSAQNAAAASIPSHFQPYAPDAVDSLKTLKTIGRSKQYEILRTYSDLRSRRYFHIMPTGPISAENIFHSQDPVISWKGDGSRITCDTVIYADNSAQYFYKKFKQLRQRALELLDLEKSLNKSSVENDCEYNAIIDEINQILHLVEAAYPPSFFQIDRQARYLFTPSEVLAQKLLDPIAQPFGFMTVSHIKFGSDDWIPVHSGLKGIANFIDEPNAEDDKKIYVSRDLNPMEACLQNLELSVIGTIQIRRTVSRIILEPLPPWLRPR
ncbi:MAG: hypothetical protein KC505_10735 [Myxococcales bacterium]|nr:hypothetical protein [Myxococcales bacterium]USN50041.1 MAG: hypothetical protein H6731_07140 [Myxococcales bacterium]